MAENSSQSWMLVPENKRSLAVTIGTSTIVHGLLLVLIIFLLSRLQKRIRVRPATEGYVQSRVNAVYVPSRPAAGGFAYNKPVNKHRLTKRVPVLETQLSSPGKDSPATQALRQLASQHTSAMTMSLNFHGVYLNHVYKLAVQTGGDMPVVSSDELPPHFQSYIVIEITIDVDGTVADARTVAGVMTPIIEQKLLSAVKKFTYNPATRDGLPIPSQRDIVIHIPT